MTPTEDIDLTEDFIIPNPLVTSASSPGVVYVSFTRTDPTQYSLGTFQCVLKFFTKEVDPSTGAPEEDGYEDEYQIEQVELAAGGDYIVPSYATFASEWEKLKDGATAVETFSLSAMDSIKGMYQALQVLAIYSIAVHPRAAACDSIIEILAMEPLGGSEIPTSSSVHTLNLSGIVAGGGGKVLVRARMTYASGQGVTLELGVRAEQQPACDLVLSAIGG